MSDPRAASHIIVEALSAIFGTDLRCAILKGSVLRGDVIPYFSDLDVHAFVVGAGEHRAPAWPQAIAFQERIGDIDPEAFGVGGFQISFIDADHYPKEWAPSWPGTYEVLWGSPPSIFSTVRSEDYLRRARWGMRGLPGWVASVVRSYADKPNAALPRLVRLTGTYLKGALYDAAMLLTHDPETVLTASFPELVALVGPVTGATDVLNRFYGSAAAWPITRTQVASLREMFKAGMISLEALMKWANWVIVTSNDT